jgi:hypothetical protein
MWIAATLDFQAGSVTIALYVASLRTRAIGRHVIDPLLAHVLPTRQSTKAVG